MNEITAEALEKKLANGETLSMIDVREDEEVAEGTIPGAVHIPLGQLTERLPEIKKEGHHFIICRSGGRSGQACDILHENGFTVTNMVGGMLEWKGEIEK